MVTPTVARWESGTTRPTRDRIEVFGQALNLSPAEIEGLMRLAGFERESAYPTRTQRLEKSADTGATASVGGTEDDGPEEAESGSRDDTGSHARGQNSAV